VGTLGAGVAILSHQDVIKIGISGDESCIPNPKELVALFEKNFDMITQKK